MLVLGDEASIHGKMIPLLSIGRYTSSPFLVHLLNEPDFLHLNRSSVQDLGQTKTTFFTKDDDDMWSASVSIGLYTYTHTLLDSSR